MARPIENLIGRLRDNRFWAKEDSEKKSQRLKLEEATRARSMLELAYTELNGEKDGTGDKAQINTVLIAELRLVQLGVSNLDAEQIKRLKKANFDDNAGWRATAEFFNGRAEYFARRFVEYTRSNEGVLANEADRRKAGCVNSRDFARAQSRVRKRTGVLRASNR